MKFTFQLWKWIHIMFNQVYMLEKWQSSLVTCT